MPPPEPEALHARGPWPLPDRPCVAVVGSRTPSPYGEAVAEQLANDLARAGVIIVSGLARGIDAAAHKGCLEAGGQTVKLDDQGSAGVGREAHMKSRLDRAHDQAVHHLERPRHHAGGDNHRDRAGRAFHVVEQREQRAIALRRADQALMRSYDGKEPDR